MSNEKKQDMELISYEKLTQKMVIDVFCAEATPIEAFKFVQLCKAQKLNPFLKEAYCVKYGGEFTMLVAYEVYLKRADDHPQFDGYETFFSNDFKECTIVVFRKDRKHPTKVTVYYDECVQVKKDGTPTKFWKKRPKGQFEKCSISQGLRRAFPNEFRGTYSDAEFDPAEAINITKESTSAFEEKGAVEMPVEKVKAEVVDEDNNVVEKKEEVKETKKETKTTKTKSSTTKKMTAAEKNLLIQDASKVLYKNLMEMNDKDHDKSLAHFTKISGEPTLKGLELERILEIGKLVADAHQLFLDSGTEEEPKQELENEDVPF